MRCVRVETMYTHAVAAIVGEGRAKVVSAVPVGIPRKAVVGTVEG